MPRHLNKKQQIAINNLVKSIGIELYLRLKKVSSLNININDLLLLTKDFDSFYELLEKYYKD